MRASHGSDIAVVGLAGRFPGARSIAEYWENLRNGVESVTFGSAPSPNASGFVPASATMPDFDRFDAELFGISARDAELLDPQHRVLLECAWEALEHAGIDPARARGPIGCFAGATLNTYLLVNIVRRSDLFESLDPMQVNLLAGGDFLATRVSYKLGLRGPSYTVQSACSTSLLAVHLACQSLLDQECDAALAGGVSVNVKLLDGYRYVEGGIVSPDGHCRAFDAAAQGTIFGSGAGVVVLKRLADAQADGDTIYAVVLGSAVNNDGSVKVGYTAPSVEGQAAVIGEALAAAGVPASSVSYVEAHGTGTALGDPIEVRALTEAFALAGGTGARCGLGSVKTNVGHLDAAAGVAGFIKTVLMLKHGELLPSLHYQSPNPQLALETTPFYVTTRHEPWPRGETPRRAGVSAFGVGGTNVHVVLEEPPAQAPSSLGRRAPLLLMSARSTAALTEQRATLAATLECSPDLPLADVAYTLAVGRRASRERAMAVCTTAAEAVSALRDERLACATATERPVVLVISGESGHRAGTGAGLYAEEPLFRALIDEQAARLAPRLGVDLREVLYPAEAAHAWASEQLRRPAIAVPAQFLTLAAWVKVWEAWGVTPQAIVGLNLSEYVAAWAAGVWTLDEALDLMATYGQLTESLAPGAMLAVRLDAETLRSSLDPPLEIAAINGPTATVVGGPAAAVARFEQQLRQGGVSCQQLETTRAFHTAMVESIVPAWTAAVTAVPPRRPTRPFVSNVTGRWISDADAQSPAYWARQSRAPVQGATALMTAAEDRQRVLLDVGPDTQLAQLAQQTGLTAFASAATGDADLLTTMLTTLGRLWLAGVDVDWTRFYHGQNRRRVPLPTYPFERRRYWIEPVGPTAIASADAKPIASDPPRHPRPDLSSPYASPANDLERQIVKIWETTLGVAPIGVNDNFFDLGGSSLIAIELIDRLKLEANFEVPVTAMYEALTVRALVTLLAPDRAVVLTGRRRAAH